MNQFLKKTSALLLRLAPWIIAATIIWGSTAVFMGIAYNYSNSKSIIIEIGMAVVTLIGLVALPWSVIGRALKSKVVASVGVFLAIMLVATVFSVDPVLSWYSHLERGVGVFFILLCVVGSFFAALIARYTGKVRTAILYPIGIAGAAVGFSAVLGYSGWNLSPSVILGHASAGGGLFGNTSYAGTILLMSLFASLYLLMTARGFWERVLAFVLGFLTLVNPIVFSLWLFNGNGKATLGFLGDARGATLSLVLGLVVSCGVYLSISNAAVRRWAGRIVVAGVIVATVVGLVMLVNPRSSVHSFFVKETGEARFLYWEMSIKSFEHHPVIGTGPETFRYAHQAYFNPQLITIGELWADKPHNAYLETLVTTGGLGLLAYLGMISMIIWQLYRLSKKEHYRLAVSLAAGLLFAYLLNNVILFDIAGSYLFFYLFVFLVSYEGVIAGKHLLVSQEKGESQTARHAVLGGLLGIAILAGTLSIVIPEATKLHLLWNEMFAAIPARTQMYQKVEDASPYGAAISIAQRVDAYSQDYLHQQVQDPKDTLADIDALTSVIDTSIKRYPPNMQSYIALGQLAWARMTITGKVDPASVQELGSAGTAIIALSPTNPKGYTFLGQAYVYEGQLALALQTFQKGLALDPAVPESQQNMAYIAQVMKAQGN